MKFAEAIQCLRAFGHPQSAVKFTDGKFLIYETERIETNAEVLGSFV